MGSVTFPIALGGDGSTVTDDASSTTGLANGGHRLRFVQSLFQFVTVANYTVSYTAQRVVDATAQVALATAQANAAAASAATALNAPGTQATSTNTLTVGTGSQTLTLAQTGKTFTVGQFVQVVNSGSAWMTGVITAFNPSNGVMTFTPSYIGGSGSFSAWTVSPAAPPEIPSVAGNAGKVLLTDGIALIWGQLYPSQVGNAGKALVTDGSTVSWSLVYPSQTGNSGKSLVTDGTSASWVGTSCRLFFLSQS